MAIANKANLMKRDILKRLSKLSFDGKLIEEVNKIPALLIPRDSKNFRCCVYKDRAIIKYRMISSMGFDLGDIEKIEGHSPAEFARMIPQRTKPEFPILTFIDDACKGCVRTNYFVTNVCKNCVARPCIHNCPKDAINREEFQANIDPAKCINCGICQKVCPYHAIVYVPVPCEESCPVNALYKDAEGNEHIDYSKCIYCGKCTQACPFNAIMEKSQIIDIIDHMKAGRQVIAMVAPSVIGQYNANLGQIAKALKTLGFNDVAEVAYGADTTIKTEAAEFVERMEQGDKMMGTSCCPAYVEAVKKHAPAFIPFVSHAKTPMYYTAEMVKSQFPDSIGVFIGPCVAKKHEGLEDPNVDYVLTFEELSAMFDAKAIDLANITVSEAEEKELFILHDGSALGRGFPVSNGVASAVKALHDAKGGELTLTPILIDGLSPKNMKLLKLYATKKAPGNLVEVMSCEGGCIHGPGVVEDPRKAQRRLTQLLSDTEKPEPA